MSSLPTLESCELTKRILIIAEKNNLSCLYRFSSTVDFPLYNDLSLTKSHRPFSVYIGGKNFYIHKICPSMIKTFLLIIHLKPKKLKNYGGLHICLIYKVKKNSYKIMQPPRKRRDLRTSRCSGLGDMWPFCWSHLIAAGPEGKHLAVMTAGGRNVLYLSYQDVYFCILFTMCSFFYFTAVLGYKSSIFVFSNKTFYERGHN
jgi:hypothetical protein